MKNWRRRRRRRINMEKVFNNQHCTSSNFSDLLPPPEGNYDFGDTDSIKELDEEEFEIHEAVYIQVCSVVQH